MRRREIKVWRWVIYYDKATHHTVVGFGLVVMCIMAIAEYSACTTAIAGCVVNLVWLFEPEA